MSYRLLAGCDEQSFASASPCALGVPLDQTVIEGRTPSKPTHPPIERTGCVQGGRQSTRRIPPFIENVPFAILRSPSSGWTFTRSQVRKLPGGAHLSSVALPNGSRSL